MSFIRKKKPDSGEKIDEGGQQSIFGCLLTSSSGLPFNGLRRANDDFLRAIIRYSRFREIHIFAHLSELELLRRDWFDYIHRFGSDKAIHFLPVYELPDYFTNTRYQVFHQGDPYIGHLAALRDNCAASPFPLIGRAHTLSTDNHLSHSKDLLLSPLKNCDAILCSSDAQQQVMKRLLGAASASIADHIGVAIPYKGALGLLPLGVDADDIFTGTQEEARKNLGYPPDDPIILSLGRISPADKMDLQPLLLAMNDLVENHGLKNVQLVIAGAGDAGSESVQSLLRQAYELNLEGRVRFELSLDDERKQWLLAACDIFVSLSDNLQESFGLAPVEAMICGRPVVLSDWNGYKELVEDGSSGYLIETLSANHDELSRYVGTLVNSHAHLLQAQGVAVNIEQLVRVLQTLLLSEKQREQIGQQAKVRVQETFAWPGLINDYHKLVEQLNQEAKQLSAVASRPAGLPYHQVFGHYPSGQLDDQQVFSTTDRGVRILLKSEQGFYYSELDYLLDKEAIRFLAQTCLPGVTLADLKQQFSDHALLQFTVLWMCKYQLLSTADQSIPSAKPLADPWLPEPNHLSADIVQHLHCPEPHRFKLLEPVLSWFASQCDRYLDPNPLVSLKPALINHLLNRLDESLLQAIGWVSREQDNTRYADILDDINQQGGLVYLAKRYPHWYRINRYKVLGSLQGIKRLTRRFWQDIKRINQIFADQWGNEASEIVGLQWLDNNDNVIIITLDNGQSLVYKNRDLRIDRQIIGSQKGSIGSQVNGWLNSFPGLMTYTIIPAFDGGHYGYCEFIDVAGENQLTPEAGADYFCRVGVLSGFSLLLGIGDLYPQNVMVRDGQPCLLDVEMAFHSNILRIFEQELDNPVAAFMRGLSETAFDKTCLWQLLETFHASKIKNSNVSLNNGEIEPASAQQWVFLEQNCLQIGSRHSLDGIQPSLAAEYADQVEEGVRAVFAAVTDNIQHWSSLLQQCAGMNVCHQPMIKELEIYKQLWDLHTFSGFQAFSRGRLKQYYRRIGMRLGLAGEEVQRWLPEHWQEPSSELASALCRGWLKGSKPRFYRQLGSPSLQLMDDGRLQPVSEAEHYFQQDNLQSAIGSASKLANDQELYQQYLNGFCAMLRQWLEEQLVPGASLPEELRQTLKP